jgi:hypothetical protein
MAITARRCVCGFKSGLLVVSVVTLFTAYDARACLTPPHNYVRHALAAVLYGVYCARSAPICLKSLPDSNFVDLDYRPL